MVRAIRGGSVSLRFAMLGAMALVFASGVQALGQAITIDSNSIGTPIDRKFTQIEPTKVDLPQGQIDARGHQELLRALSAEQGFAMRPLPRGKRGLILEANGKLTPSGSGYVASVTANGLSVNPGDRVVLSYIRIDKEKIVFDLNGGPEHKHEFLRHIQIGMGGGDAPMSPVVRDDGQEPAGARITLTFNKYVPEVTPAQVKALLAPLISFDLKTPVQAYTDTLPPKLKQAILEHNVLVGMSTQMVLFAMGQPETKSREMDGQMPIEEWIYGHPPQDVKFVRVNGNRVIRVEIARLGQPLEIFTKNEVEGLTTTDGQPVLAEVERQRTRTVEMGDAHPDKDTQAPAPPPTLRAPGEKLPTDDPSLRDPSQREDQMGPVIFPKDTTNDPARTVDAHPAKPANPPAADGPAPANPDASKTENTDKSGKPGDAPANSPPPSPSPAPASPATAPAPSNFLEEAQTPVGR
jgi:hypothetical protein